VAENRVKKYGRLFGQEGVIKKENNMALRRQQHLQIAGV